MQRMVWIGLIVALLSGCVGNENPEAGDPELEPDMGSVEQTDAWSYAGRMTNYACVDYGEGELCNRMDDGENRLMYFDAPGNVTRVKGAITLTDAHGAAWTVQIFLGYFEDDGSFVYDQHPVASGMGSASFDWTITAPTERVRLYTSATLHGDVADGTVYTRTAVPLAFAVDSEVTYMASASS